VRCGDLSPWEPSWEPFAVDGREPLRTQMDVEPFRSGRVWTVADTHGPGLEIYGSEGWGFESSRAR
jgi:hypothetical protein